MNTNGSEAEVLGKRLRRLRLARGLSQRDLSEPGVSYAYISRVEAGARNPSVKALRKIAGKLGVTVEYLEKGDDSTETDTLLRELGEAADRAIRVTVGRKGGVFLRAELDGHKLEASGPTLTEALVAVLRDVRDIQALRKAAADLEARAREIERRR